MKHIGNLQYADGAKGKDKRIGRGPGSGHGGTATRGNKGAQSRRGYKRKIAFEGGQMPMSRRVPKFGFFNPNRVEYQIINVGRIQEIIDDKVLSENKISPEILYNIGAISNRTLPVKILGNGELKTVVEIEAHKISAQAKQKIESVGGKVTIYG